MSSKSVFPCRVLTYWGHRATPCGATLPMAAPGRPEVKPTSSFSPRAAPNSWTRACGRLVQCGSQGRVESRREASPGCEFRSRPPGVPCPLWRVRRLCRVCSKEFEKNGHNSDVAVPIAPGVLLITVSFLWLQALQSTELKVCRKLAWGCRSHPRTGNQGDGD